MTTRLFGAEVFATLRGGSLGDGDAPLAVRVRYPSGSPRAGSDGTLQPLYVRSDLFLEALDAFDECDCEGLDNATRLALDGAREFGRRVREVQV